MSEVRHVTIAKAAELTGVSQDAIRTNIKRGVWLEGHVWVKAPNGRIFIDLEGYEAWVTGAQSLPHRRAA
jgi:hypothetical protein